jgi:hypothetical protein
LIDNEIKKREKFEQNNSGVDLSMLKSGKFDFLIISSSNKWKKAFDFFIVILALYSTYSCTYL